MEYKTYKCDICAAPDAVRFTFPCVDYQEDGNGERCNIKGDVDLCTSHIKFLFELFLTNFKPTMDQQRLLWKAILKK